MIDLSYFNLGFRSDTVSKLLEEIKLGKSTYDEALNDATLILKDCLKVEDKDVLVSNFTNTKGYEMKNLLPLLAELYIEKSVEQALSELKEIYNTIINIKTGKKKVSDEEYSDAIVFFSELADLCLSNSVHQLNTDKSALI